jgi:predicted RNA-binding protein with PIN domain
MSERLVIIDGYNLIHRTPALKPGADRSLEQAREKLLNLLAWAFGTGGAQFIVVFDGTEGHGKSQHAPRVEVRYSKAPDTADDLIRRLVEERVENEERLTVVTADLEVARHARAMGADVALSDLFLASALGPTPDAAQPTDKPTTLSKKEIEEWAEIFRRRSNVAEDSD